MIRLTIDGQEVTVPEGTMIVDAAARLGVDVPVYCYHQALGPLGACRMCLVQVEKMPKLVTGCTTAVAEGMVVHTKGSAVEKGRKGVLEFLLINHPLDCPVCDKGGECYLQDYTFEYGPGRGRFQEPKIQKVKNGPINDLVLIDQERCVLCQRCVRFMGDYVGEEQLLLEGRGVETVVTTVDHQPATSQFTGNVIDLCPVGALLSAPYYHKGRPWNIDRHSTVCPHCPVGCSSLATTRESHIIRMEGRPVPDRDWGWLCDRGRFGYDFGYHADRIADSWVKERATSAAQATRDVAEWMQQTNAQYGPGSIGFVMGGQFTAEEAHLIKKFAHGVAQSDNVAVMRSVRGYLPAALNGTFQDLADADTVVFVGVDPYEAVPVVHLKLRDRLRHFSQLKVLGVGPRRLTRDTMPGQDYLVASQDEAVFFARALAAAAKDGPGVQTLVDSVRDYVLPVSDADIEAFGQALLSAEHLSLLWDGENAAMEEVLAVLAGIREKPTAVLPTFGPVNWRGYEQAGMDPRYDNVEELLNKTRAGEIRMLVLWGADLTRDLPDRQLAEQALAQADYVVSAQVVPPLDMPYIDALLPVATWGEVEGTYVNMEGRLSIGAAGVQPPGQARPTRTYVANWGRLFRQDFGLDDEWDPFDSAQGDLIARAGDNRGPAQAVPLPVARDASREWTVIEGDWVMENGMPSEILEPRETEFAARVSPEDAARLGIGEHGGYVEAQTAGGTVMIGVQRDPAIVERTLWIPRGSRHDWAQHLEGLVKLTRAEEVPSV